MCLLGQLFATEFTYLYLCYATHCLLCGMSEYFGDRITYFIAGERNERRTDRNDIKSVNVKS